MYIYVIMVCNGGKIMEEKDINKNCDCHDCADECGENCSCNHEETDSIVIEMEDENGERTEKSDIFLFGRNGTRIP